MYANVCKCAAVARKATHTVITGKTNTIAISHAKNGPF